MSTRTVQPRDADTITFLQVGNAGAKRNYDASAFVPGNKRKSWFDRPITLSGMQICVADTACDDFN
jgi:hypothetical protein